MAINITPTTIQVGNFKFRETDTGIEFTGQANTAGFVGGSQAQGSVSGYTSGGYTTPPATRYTNIDKFPFASDANATDVGDLTQARQQPSGSSSTTSGYNSGGFAPPMVNTIDKFPFAVDTNATDVGDLTQARNQSAGQTSTTNGYASGGNTPGGHSNVIDRISFAVDINATDVGDLSLARREGAGQSSGTHGYTSGGYPAPRFRR